MIFKGGPDPLSPTQDPHMGDTPEIMNLQHKHKYFISLSTGSIELDHYARECEF